MITVFGKLVANEKDFEGYETYVFKLLDNDSIEQIQSSFLMCVRYPNWESSIPQLGEPGYIKVNEVRAGIDQWYDGIKMNKYKYDDIIFYKFIKKPEEHTNELFL